MASIIEEACKHLPKELSKRLAEARAVLPVKGKKPTVAAWKSGVSPSAPFRGDGLAVMTGSISGITVLDIDSKSLSFPFNPNVDTRRGYHVWFKSDSRPSRTNLLKAKGVSGVDLKGEGGYCVFMGPGKRLLHTDVRPIDELDSWLSSIPIPAESSSIDSQDLLLGLSKRIEYEANAPVAGHEAYKALLEAENYQVDVDWVMKTYVSQLRSTLEGERNIRLYRLALEGYRIGGDINMLAEAAANCGLDSKEIAGTIDSALMSLQHDPRLEETVLQRVQAWRAFYPFSEPILDWVAYQAVRQNSLRPLIVQTECAEAIDRTSQGVGKALSIFEHKRGLLRKYENPGFRPGGLRHSNNYQLTVNGKESWPSKR